MSRIFTKDSVQITHGRRGQEVYPMIRFARWYIVLALLVFSIQAFAGFKDYQIAFDNNDFLMEGVFQVLATDLDGDLNEELLVAGKNYIGRELFVYLLSVKDGYKPSVQWQSPNLFEERSVIWIASGKFNDLGKVLLVMTNTRFYLYRMEGDGLRLVGEYHHQLEPLGVTAGDIDGDGWDELLVTRVGDVTSKMYRCYLQVWKLTENGWQATTKTDLLGNIRGLTAGDIDGDGIHEIFVEEGLRVEPGTVHMLRYKDGKFGEVAKVSNEIKGAAYSLKVKAFPEGVRLMTASTRGKVNFFRYEGSKLVKDPEELSFNSELTDSDAIELDNDGDLEIALIGYPRRLMILHR